ncbi:MAG: tyrosine-type recombinase/integrase [Ignavibacteriaceae bacterium]|jgi:integrase/recombinase XerD
MTTIQSAINQFFHHCRYEKNLSPKTLKSYGIDLTQLTNFLIEKNHSLQVKQITKTELREYLERISTLKPKSVKRKVATIKAMFNYLEFEDTIDINPMRKIRIKIQEAKRLPRVMDIREIGKIFKCAYSAHTETNTVNSHPFMETLRNIVVVELLFITGARVSEISNLKMENIDLTTGSVSIKGKGNKERFIQICNHETLKILKEYYKVFTNKINGSGGFFLINRLGGKLSDQSIRQIVKNLSGKANIQKNITPHVFRHTFATLLLEKDVDIKYIQTLLGHSSIMTTQIYTHVNRAKQKQILRTKHPRKDFSMLVPLVI